MPGVMHSVGVLKDGKATDDFKRRTMNRLKENNPDVIPPDIDDEKKYPDFHTLILPKYEEIANALDLQGNFSLPPPIMDPFALVGKLAGPDAMANLKYDITKLPTINPAELAMMLADPIPDMTLIKFLATVPKLISVPVPPAPPAPPPLNVAINLPPPSPFCDKFKFDAWPLALPDLFGGILGQLMSPKAIFGLVAPVPNLDFAVKAAIDAQLFGPSLPGDKMKLAVVKDMSEFTAKAVVVGATASVIGDGGPSGVVGKLAIGDFKWVEDKRPPQPAEEGLSRVRQKFLTSLEKVMGPYSENWKMIGTQGPYTGYQSVGKPGAGGVALCPGYKPGPAPVGEFGTKVTSCGILPAFAFSLFVQDTKDDAEFQMADSKQRKAFACGPQGVFLLGKYMRAYVPAASGALPKPGDIYFVCEASMDVKHIGVIYKVNPQGGSNGWHEIITADAGQGPAEDQALAWVKKQYDPVNLTLKGSNGAGADGPPTDKPARRIKGWLDIDKLMGHAFGNHYRDAWKMQIETPKPNPLVWHSNTTFTDNDTYDARVGLKMEKP